jgi:WD40 repeat protein
MLKLSSNVNECKPLHEGTVTALAQVGPYLVSGSTDKSVRLWRDGDGHNMTKYPAFEQLSVGRCRLTL